MIRKFLDLGIQPLANQYLNKPKNLSIKKGQLYNLNVCFNSKTKLVSISKKIPVKKMFKLWRSFARSAQRRADRREAQEAP